MYLCHVAPEILEIPFKCGTGSRVAVVDHPLDRPLNLLARQLVANNRRRRPTVVSPTFDTDGALTDLKSLPFDRPRGRTDRREVVMCLEAGVSVLMGVAKTVIPVQLSTTRLTI